MDKELAAYRAKHHAKYLERKRQEAIAAGATLGKPTVSTPSTQPARGQAPNPPPPTHTLSPAANGFSPLVTTTIPTFGQPSATARFPPTQRTQPQVIRSPMAPPIIEPIRTSKMPLTSTKADAIPSASMPMTTLPSGVQQTLQPSHTTDAPQMIPRAKFANAPPSSSSRTVTYDADFVLARKLQEEEDRRQAQLLSQDPGVRPPDVNFTERLLTETRPVPVVQPPVVRRAEYPPVHSRAYGEAPRSPLFNQRTAMESARSGGSPVETPSPLRSEPLNEDEELARAIELSKKEYEEQQRKQRR